MSVVHLLRHGEVHNPAGILYGLRPGYHLSERGRRMAASVAGSFSSVDLVLSSPLERAVETASFVASRFGLAARTDVRLIEGASAFEGDVLRGLWWVRHWRRLHNPFRPSWGEPYLEQVSRMASCVEEARSSADVAVLVGHQLPIWVTRQWYSSRRLWHLAGERECELASVTTLTFSSDGSVSVSYRAGGSDQ